MAGQAQQSEDERDEVAGGGCMGCPPPRNPFPGNAMGAAGGGYGVGTYPSLFGANGISAGNPIED